MATDEGKRIVKDFIKTVKDRLLIEHLESRDDLSSILLSTVFYFMKYLIGELIDEKTGKNSLIFVYGEMSDGQRIFTHNILTDKENTAYIKNKEEFALTIINMLSKEEKGNG
jgi:hypothetical protein